ncbi:SMP-30/gluconolactonase/LRE family protein [soil metagenome]
MAEPICVVPAGDWTGEGAVWHDGEQAVYWVDIGRFLIHRFETRTGNVRNWLFTEPVTTLGLTDRTDTLIVATASKLILWQPANDARADFASPERGRQGVRFNDGRPDPAGNFWVGSMHFGEGAEKGKGKLFRVNADGSSTTEKSGIGVSNTFCWSPDNTRFYFGDTMTNVISVWDYDVHTGRISAERPFFSGFARGGPDGSAMDRDGYLWNARYGGSCIVRVAPDGKVDRIVEMPVTNITTCTFGGPDLKILYITSARFQNERLAGSLFALSVDVPGLPENRFRLAANPP